MKKWRNKDGSIKIHQIRTTKSYDGTIDEIEKYMDFLGIAPEHWEMRHFREGKVALAFMNDGVHYLMTSEKQTRPKGLPSIKDNARAIFHIIKERVLEMRKGVDSVESLFGGFVNYLSTPKLPERMERELRQRGVTLMLPAPPRAQDEMLSKGELISDNG